MGLLSVQILFALFYIVNSFLVVKYTSIPSVPQFKSFLHYKNRVFVHYSRTSFNFNSYTLKCLRVLQSFYPLRVSTSAENVIDDVATSITETNKTVTNSRLHTSESKAKISAANKGKLPWNAGKQHSEETKRRIAEKTRESIMKKKLEKAAQMGMTLEELENSSKKTKVEKHNATLKGGLTEEGRKKISDSMKRRWQAPDYKEVYSQRMRGTRNHSEATREKISKAIKEKWQDDDYRNIERKSPTEDVRARISATLKARWDDPSFRQMMMNHTFTRTAEWRAVVSRKVRDKWKDPVYKDAVAAAMRRHFELVRLNNGNMTSRSTSRRRRSSGGSGERVVLSKEAQLERRRETARLQREAKVMRNAALKAAKTAARSSAKDGGKGPKPDLKALMGGELWFEEKMKRKKDGVMFMDDDSLQKQLLEEWSQSAEVEDEGTEVEEDIPDDDELAGNDYYDDDMDFLELLPLESPKIKSLVGGKKASGRKSVSKSRKSVSSGSKDEDGESSEGYFDDDEEGIGRGKSGEYDDEVDDMYDDEMSNVEEDLIEVYDEDGELVGVYDVEEFLKIKAGGVPA
mmetsp:Transcript_12987/g.19544  ORF Transcript_12987/g.19544 Transcript_12987/m.19544 type:complete len:573 (-) Transcript_12987:22-1740(-)